MRGKRADYTWDRVRDTWLRLQANQALTVDELGGGHDAVGLVSLFAALGGTRSSRRRRACSACPRRPGRRRVRPPGALQPPSWAPLQRKIDGDCQGAASGRVTGSGAGGCPRAQRARPAARERSCPQKLPAAARVVLLDAPAAQRVLDGAESADCGEPRRHDNRLEVDFRDLRLDLAGDAWVVVAPPGAAATLAAVAVGLAA